MRENQDLDEGKSVLGYQDQEEGYQDCAHRFQNWDGCVRIGKGISYQIGMEVAKDKEGVIRVGKRDIRFGRVEIVLRMGTSGFGR
jgi:hypothetical protein